MSSSDENKPDDVKDEVWQQHLDWMRVMESSRHHGPPLKKLMDQYFLPPDEGEEEDGSSSRES
jgi:hypothetical protein